MKWNVNSSGSHSAGCELAALNCGVVWNPCPLPQGWVAQSDQRVSAINHESLMALCSVPAREKQKAYLIRFSWKYSHENLRFRVLFVFFFFIQDIPTLTWCCSSLLTTLSSLMSCAHCLSIAKIIINIIFLLAQLAEHTFTLPALSHLFHKTALL